MAVSAPTQYQEVLDAIGNYYGVGSDQWVGFSSYGLAYHDLENTLSQVPGVKIYQNNAGAITGYAYENPFPYSDGGAAGAINSNVQLPTQGNGNTFMGNIPASGTIDQSGNAQFSSGARRVSDNSVVPSTLSMVTTAIVGLSVGTKLGTKLLNGIYNSDPDFWENTLPTINPQTWDSIASTKLGKSAINAIFGIDKNTGNTQMYIPEDAFSYYAYAMAQLGMFNSTTSGETGDHGTMKAPPAFSYGSFMYGSGQQFLTNLANRYGVVNYTAPLYAIGFPRATGSQYYTIRVLSTQPFTWSNSNPASPSNATRNVNYGENYPIYYADLQFAYSVNSVPTSIPVYREPSLGSAMMYDILYTGKVTETPTYDGIEVQDGQTMPDISNWTSPAATAEDLAIKYSDAYQNAIYTDVPQPDGTTTRIKYIPINTTATKGSEDTTPTNTTVTYNQTVVNGSTSDEDLIKTILRYITQTQSDSKSDTPTPPNTPNPTDTGDGNTPPVVVPTGSASALWSVYNPSQAQLNSFGAWLWSSNFIDQILKLFNNPMQSIIGVHKIFATPATSGAGNITVGYLDSGVSANLVSNQYTNINCGTVNVREQFGNVFDYTDTHIRLYLPFVGIVDLDTADVMRGSVSVVYHVDVITGACLAEVKVMRDASGGTLYQFAGDAAVRYPISSGSYMGVVAGIASAIGGVASAVMTGGATLPLAAGAVAGGISGAHTQVQHSGNFSGNAGAMGGKKPYLIIERPQSYVADDFKHWQGLGANARRTVGQMSGYFKFSDVHTESISKAAESEIEAIRAALESGVIA